MDRQTRLLTNAPLCRARTKRGTACRCPAMRGKRVCRIHGGKSPGAPRGKDNGKWKHGGETKESIAMRRAASALLKQLG
ncbi:hypothetical protein C0V74_04340 [Altererythrobacter sp. TH136]|nr:hypothetical protein C0V74_04340 [Altererythrobacter sp. TH136]